MAFSSIMPAFHLFLDYLSNSVSRSGRVLSSRERSKSVLITIGLNPTTSLIDRGIRTALKFQLSCIHAGKPVIRNYTRKSLKGAYATRTRGKRTQR